MEGAIGSSGMPLLGRREGLWLLVHVGLGRMICVLMALNVGDLCSCGGSVALHLLCQCCLLCLAGWISPRERNGKGIGGGYFVSRKMNLLKCSSDEEDRGIMNEKLCIQRELIRSTRS